MGQKINLGQAVKSLKSLNKDKVFIVIAAYNEEKKIAKVVKGLQTDGYHSIVVVDDGSKDKTYEAAVDSGAHVLRHVANRGQGAALKTGMDYALIHGAEYIVHFDADGQHSPKDIIKMIAPVLSGRADVALGSRFIKKEKNKEPASKEPKIPFSRKLLLKGAVLVQWMFYGIKLTDAHNGFRCFSRKAAKQVRIRSDRMEHASEIIEEIVKHKLKYEEVPVTIKYDEYSLSHGHGSFTGAIKVLIKMIIKKITG